MIFIKWIKYSGTPSDLTGPGCAPNLLIELINMFFFKSAAEPGSCQVLYPGQAAIQIILILFALVSVPVMLLVKPTILYMRHKKKIQKGHRLSDIGHTNPLVNATGVDNVDLNIYTVGSDEIPPKRCSEEFTSEEINPQDHHFDMPDEEPFEIGEVAVEQCIHTIEYFLGCISNTASYLRLWALSLAHAELSEVLWSMVLRHGTATKASYGFIMLWAVFAGWALFTVAVLLLMEGLSAFLHALRLHWVEFQNKFYKGEGYEFLPFSFSGILKDAEIKE